MSHLKSVLLGVAAVAAATVPRLGQAQITTETLLSQWQSDAGTLGTETTNFGDGERAHVNSVSLGDGTGLSFDSTMITSSIGDAWATWCCSYSGQVLFTRTATDIDFTLTPPAGDALSAFGMFIEPLNFGPFEITLDLSDGDSVSQSVDGDGGADFFGWVGLGVTGFTISADPATGGFAVGDFFSVEVPQSGSGSGSGTDSVAEPGTLTIFGGALAAFAGARSRRRSRPA
jgi:hypothetical protein